MISGFDLEQLKSLLMDFYRITRIRITVFDSGYRELVSYPESWPEFCARIRETEEGSRACAECDREACAYAAGQTKAHIYRCHAGLTEAIMPLHVGSAPVGYLLFGHVFAYESFEEGWRVIRECVAKYPVEEELLRVAAATMPLIPRDYIRSAARILHMTASYLLQERMATLQADSAAALLDAYLSANYTRNETADEIAGNIGIGRSRLFRLSKELYGCGISEQIRKLRMEKARELLLDRPDLNITEIATDLGYEDYNYFIAVFSRNFGMSPGKFRREGKK